MKFGSVCSGIEAASVAWGPLGWKAAWVSEIEPFPSAVLAHHYPDVPNLGDMTTLPERILSGEVEAPDLFCGGTPCQAFSVAGLRNSLDDARGNLSLVFCEIANAIDEVRSVRGLDQSIIFWENVPGVLSTKDNAFGCFLGALAGEDDPLIAPRGKWTNAGCVYGPQRAVAWRVLDAQYFGVAQRRRRVFVVASARDDFDPAAVLFEFDGLRRDSAPSRETGQRVAPCVTNGPPFSRTGNERVEAEAMIVGALDLECGASKLTHQSVANGHIVAARMVAFGEYSIDGTASAMKARDWKDATDLVAQPINFGAQMSVPQVDFDLCQTLQAKNPMAVAQPIAFQQTADCLTAAYGTKWNGNASATNGSLFAAQPIPIDTMNMTPRHSSGGLGFGQPGDPSFTLTKGHSHTVAQPIGWDEELNASTEQSGTLLRGGQGGRHDGVMTSTMQVRRLTPVECERLQGFPDNYTNIPWRKKPEAPDGPRYKALGNSWAVPVVRWIGERIAKAT
jgi:DNA (cytosine-5)-methyltransferase 1